MTPHNQIFKLFGFALVGAVATAASLAPASAQQQEQAQLSAELQPAAQISATASGARSSDTGLSFEARPIPQERMNVRRVGPRFLPDPSNSLDFGQPREGI